MKFVFLLFSIFLFVGCDRSILVEEKPEKTDVQLVNEISSKVFKKLALEQNLRPFGTGSQMMDEIKMIALSFKYYGSVDEGKARELLLAATNELVSAINSEERVHKYLYNYPFSAKNIEIRIFLHNPDGSSPHRKNLSVISVIGGVLDYEIDNPKTLLFTSVLKETYEEAVAKQEKNICCPSDAGK